MIVEPLETLLVQMNENTQSWSVDMPTTSPAPCRPFGVVRSRAWELWSVADVMAPPEKSHSPSFQTSL